MKAVRNRDHGTITATNISYIEGTELYLVGFSSRTEKTPTGVTARLHRADNRRLLTQSSKIDNAFASSAHFSSASM